MKDSCVYMPEVEGAPSTLYKDMLKKLDNDRPVINLIYSMYSATEKVAEEMDKLGYKRNKQGQHSYEDIYKYFNLGSFFSQRSSTVLFESKRIGAIDENNKFVTFSAKEAYEKASEYNENNKSKIAYVVQQGEGFNIIINEKDAITISKLNEFNTQYNNWKNVFLPALEDANMLELLDVLGDKINPNNLKTFLNTIKILKSAPNTSLSVNDIATFLILGKNAPLVQELMNRWGLSIQETAKRCYDILHDKENVSPSTLALVSNTLDDAKGRNVFNISKVLSEITKTEADFKNKDFDILIEKQIKKLKKNYNVTSERLSKSKVEIKSLHDIVEDAIVTLEREIRKIESEKGVTQTVKKLEKLKDDLSRDLTHKKSFLSMVDFLGESIVYAEKIQKMLSEVYTIEDTPERIRDGAVVLSRAHAFIGGYYDIVKSLANMDNLIIEENLSKEDKELLQDKAKSILESLERINSTIRDLSTNLVASSLEQTLGTKVEFGNSYKDIITMLYQDASLMDYVGSLAESNNTILATTGTIIRNAQHDRDEQLRRYETRIGRATKKLYKAGHNSEFMIDKDGYIITEEGVDWNKYHRAKAKAIKDFKDLGYVGLSLREAIEQWEEENTTDKVVDETNGRLERIPNSNYRLKAENNPYNKLTAAQKEYYKEVMQIKGELGSKLPYYAQSQYVPAQKRADTIDIIKYAIKQKMSAKQLALILLDRMKFWKIREDDTEFVTSTTYGNYDNTPLRDIPIQYFQQLKNKNELLLNFSTSLQHFASTAVNYEAMNNIKHQVEMLRRYVNEMEVASWWGKGEIRNKTAVDAVSYYDDREQSVKTILKRLKEAGNDSIVKSLLNSYIEQQIYNNNYKKNPRIHKAVNYLIKYNSITKLSANVLGAIANVTNGVVQTILQAGGGKFYNGYNLTKSLAILFGEQGIKSPGKIMDWLTDNKSSKFTLICDFFDVTQDTYQDAATKKYHKNVFRRMFGSFNWLAMYSTGEFFMRTLNGVAVLDHTKVLINGKKVSVLEAFELSKDSQYPKLILKEGVTDLEGNPLTMDSEFFKDIKKNIKSCSDACFGTMSSEDKGIINRYCLGKLIMNFRQWMVGTYSFRYRPKHWDYTRNEYVEGIYITPFRLAIQFIKGFRDFTTAWRVLKDNLDDKTVYNLRMVAMEFAIAMLLNSLVGDLEDEEEEWKEKEDRTKRALGMLGYGKYYKKKPWGDRYDRMFAYEVFRLNRELDAFTPIGAITEFKNLIKSPVPVINTINQLLYPITNLDDIDKTLEKGRYKDQNKYWRNVKWYVIPFYKQIDQLIHMDEEDNLFNTFTDKRL